MSLDIIEEKVIDLAEAILQEMQTTDIKITKLSIARFIQARQIENEVFQAVCDIWDQ